MIPKADIYLEFISIPDKQNFHLALLSQIYDNEFFVFEVEYIW